MKFNVLIHGDFSLNKYILKLGLKTCRHTDTARAPNKNIMCWSYAYSYYDSFDVTLYHNYLKGYYPKIYVVHVGICYIVYTEGARNKISHLYW